MYSFCLTIIPTSHFFPDGTRNSSHGSRKLHFLAGEKNLPLSLRANTRIDFAKRWTDIFWVLLQCIHSWCDYMLIYIYTQKQTERVHPSAFPFFFLKTFPEGGKNLNKQQRHHVSLRRLLSRLRALLRCYGMHCRHRIQLWVLRWCLGLLVVCPIQSNPIGSNRIKSQSLQSLQSLLSGWIWNDSAIWVARTRASWLQLWAEGGRMDWMALSLDLGTLIICIWKTHKTNQTLPIPIRYSIFNIQSRSRRCVRYCKIWRRYLLHGYHAPRACNQKHCPSRHGKFSIPSKSDSPSLPLPRARF